MAQTTTIGRVTADLELKTSVNKNPYLLFSISSKPFGIWAKQKSENG